MTVTDHPPGRPRPDHTDCPCAEPWPARGCPLDALRRLLARRTVAAVADWARQNGQAPRMNSVWPAAVGRDFTRADFERVVNHLVARGVLAIDYDAQNWVTVGVGPHAPAAASAPAPGTEARHG